MTDSISFEPNTQPQMLLLLHLGNDRQNLVVKDCAFQFELKIGHRSQIVHKTIHIAIIIKKRSAIVTSTQRTMYLLLFPQNTNYLFPATAISPPSPP